MSSSNGDFPVTASGIRNRTLLPWSALLAAIVAAPILPSGQASRPIRTTVINHVAVVDVIGGVTKHDMGGFIGFGFPGSSTSNNRSIREFTLTGAYQIVRTPDRGSAQFNTQVSWLTREPWSTPASGLSSARSFMFLAQLRYNLP